MQKPCSALIRCIGGGVWLVDEKLRLVSGGALQFVDFPAHL
jgi:hypothetical protein